MTQGEPEEKLQLTYEQEQSMMAFYAMLYAAVHVHSEFAEKNMEIFGESLEFGLALEPNRQKKKQREKINKETLKKAKANVKAWIYKSKVYCNQIHASLKEESQEKFLHYADFFKDVAEKLIKCEPGTRGQLLQMIDLHNTGMFSAMISEAELEKGVEYESVIVPEYTSVIEES